MATGYAASGREMTVGSVLGRAFGAIGAAPLRFLGTSLVLSAAPALVSPMLTRGFAPARSNATPAELFDSPPWGLMIGWGVVYLLLYLLAKAILIRTTAAVEDRGASESFGATVAASLRALLPLLAAAILCYVGIWIGMILLFVPGVILALIWATVAPAIVLERLGVIAAFGRSARLTKGARLRIVGLYLVVFVTYLVLLFAIGAGFGLGYGAAALGRQSVASQVFGVVLGTAVIAAWNAIQASLFLSLRDWKDGVSGDQLAEIFA